jgi:hypothetical protein
VMGTIAARQPGVMATIFVPASEANWLNSSGVSGVEDHTRIRCWFASLLMM